MNTEFQYKYKAHVVSVYDGDTIRVNIDLGFGMNWQGSQGKGVHLRLYGIDTPEVRGEEKEAGIVSRDRVRELILDKDVIIETVKDKTGKYGRYLAVVYLASGKSLNSLLVEEGLAQWYEV